MKRILLIAGETSGDIHAAMLLREMKKLDPGLEFFGIGGDECAGEGMEIIEHIDRMAMMGFVEVIKHIPRIKKLMKRLIREVEARKIDLVILVDYPGFNLRLAEAVKRLPHPPKIFYYISPQVWAWGAERIPKIAGLIDRMAGIIPFETDTYSGTNLDFHFVGHPLMDEIVAYESRDLFFSRHGLDIDKPLIALLPGSRNQEVSRILPCLLEASTQIRRKIDVQVAIGSSANVDSALYQNLKNVQIIKNDTRNLQKNADLVITKSGTSTLETAISGTPMIVVYKVHPISFQIGKRVVKLENIALANLVGGEKIAPEFIQDEASPENISAEAVKILTSPEIQAEQRRKLALVREKLGKPGASKRAAELALELIK